jgi:dethiobiotin synthetase
MNRGIFVTGTDTDCGKTEVALALVRGLRERGIRAAGFKPVAAGADWRDGKLQNADALALKAVGAGEFPYPTINPYCFEPAVAPHLAAAEAGVGIDVDTVVSACATLTSACDFVVAEGAGGWRVPLAQGLDMQGLALALGFPVVLVVGLRLGCLNHALLSEQAIRASGAPLLGWIGSQVDPAMARLNGNTETLIAQLSVPCLGILPHPSSQRKLDAEIALDLDALL